MISTPNQFPVRLDSQQRLSLEDITRNGHAPAKKIRHAQVLLMSDHDRPGGKVMTGPVDRRGLGDASQYRRQGFASGSCSKVSRPALERKPRETPPVPAKVDEAGSRPTSWRSAQARRRRGRVRWTILLAGELVRREVVTSISGETVRVAA